MPYQTVAGPTTSFSGKKTVGASGVARRKGGMIMMISVGRPALAAAEGLSPSGAATASAIARDQPISIAFVSGPLSDSFFPPLYRGAEQAAKDLGVKLDYIPIEEPVGVVSTGPSVVDARNIDKVMKVFNTYPDTIGSK